MKTVKRMLCVLLLCILPVSALAGAMYIIPDSNIRELTLDELREWDFETLNYIYNEIFARYGFNFEPGGRFDNWFRLFPWYTPNENTDNQTAVYPYVTDLEWRNYQRIKEVMAEKKSYDEPSHADWLKCYRDIELPVIDFSLSSFEYCALKADQTLAVYTAPSYQAYRANNGRAAVSTNGAVWAHGRENNWLLVYYETNNGSIRVGYVNCSDVTGVIPVKTTLNFSRTLSAVTRDCVLTDDPMRENQSLATLKKNTLVTYLTTYFNQNGEAWDYIETQVDGKTARGFVRHGAIEIPEEELNDLGSYGK